MRFRRAAGAAALAVLVVAVAACSRFAVRAEADPAVDFKTLRTFAWLTPEQAPPGDQSLQDRAIERRVQSSIEAGLRAKGYRPAEGDPPDLLVTYRLASEGRTTGLPTTYRGYDLGWWTRAREVHPDSYERGTLMIDLVEADDMRLVWRGTASARLLPHLSFKEKAARATDAVEHIMAELPEG